MANPFFEPLVVQELAPVSGPSPGFVPQITRPGETPPSAPRPTARPRPGTVAPASLPPSRPGRAKPTSLPAEEDHGVEPDPDGYDLYGTDPATPEQQARRRRQRVNAGYAVDYENPAYRRARVQAYNRDHARRRWRDAERGLEFSHGEWKGRRSLSTADHHRGQDHPSGDGYGRRGRRDHAAAYPENRRHRPRDRGRHD